MSDILDESEKLDRKIKRGFVDNVDQNEINLCFGLLVAEIKRLREPPQEPDWLADWKAIENGLSVSAKKWMIAYQKAQNSWIVRQQQNKALEEMVSAKDALNDDLMANCNQLRDRCWKAEGELTRWQKIAIEERAQRIISMEPEAKFDRYDLQECPQIGYICDENDGYCVLSECPSRTFWKQIAAKELQLEAANEADYVSRLETAYIADSMQSEELARAALGRIREGK